jgi:Ca-activated chloride channel family protein
MVFSNPSMLWLSIIVLPLIALFFYAIQVFKRFSTSVQFTAFSFQSNLPTWNVRYLYGFIRLLAIVLLIVGLAEPYMNVAMHKPQYKNIRIFFLLDVSGSMVYAEDIKPNRLEAARDEIGRFYNQLDGLYVCGIIPFAGEPNRYYCPLTSQSSVFTSLLSKVSPDVAPALGTDLQRVFEAVEKSIKEEKLHTGVNLIVLLTDGGKEESTVISQVKLLENVARLSRSNNRVYAIGIGSKEKVPLLQRDKKGSFVDYIRDEKNQVAYSQLDEDILVKIASRGKGEYKHFEEPNQLYSFLKKVIDENKVFDNEKLVYERLELQSYFFAVSGIMLWLGFMVNRRRP